MARRRSCIDQISDRLRLQQIELPIEHGSARELARFRLSSAGAENGRECARRNEKPSMSADLEEILTGEGMRCTIQYSDYLIDDRR
jgi:hypothetical protein